MIIPQDQNEAEEQQPKLFLVLVSYEDAQATHALCLQLSPSATHLRMM